MKSINYFTLKLKEDFAKVHGTFLSIYNQNLSVIGGNGIVFNANFKNI
jgi:hypothetical protein